MTILEGVIAEVKPYVKCGGVAPGDHLRGDLAMDSLDAVELQMALEERFALREYDLGGYPLWMPFYMPHMQVDPTIQMIADYIDKVQTCPKKQVS